MNAVGSRIVNVFLIARGDSATSTAEIADR
jgi:hypothetical protein